MRPPLLAALAFAAALPGCVPPPTVPAAGATAAFDARLGQAANLGSRIVTPLAIVEDSRCPDGAQCIQAGTVRIEARVERGADARTLVLGLGKPAFLGDSWLHLLAACPYPALSRPIAPSDYRLTLAVATSADLPPAAPPIACRPRSEA